MDVRVLVVNAGSSSLKLSALDGSMLPDDWTTDDIVARFTCPTCVVAKLAAWLLACGATITTIAPTTISAATMPIIHLVRVRIFFIFIASLILDRLIHHHSLYAALIRPIDYHRTGCWPLDGWMS